MKRFFFALLICLVIKKTTAQIPQELKIGDTLPPLHVTFLTADGVRSVPLKSLYKDNFLIIDFWATWCASCIKAMADADSIAKQFNGKIVILPVTYEDEKRVRTFVQKSKILKKLDHSYVVNDSLLMGGYFKFVTVPHEVWIDTIGVIRAITYPDQLTTVNLQLFVQNGKISLPEKREDVTFDVLQQKLPVNNDSFLYRSVLTKYQSQLQNMVGTLEEPYKNDVKLNRFIAINQNILRLFYSAYSKGYAGRIEFKRMELVVKDSIALFPSFGNDQIPRSTREENTFCYELVLPANVSEKKFYAFLLDDLNRLFSYEGVIEKRMKSCWVIITKDRKKNPSTLGGKPKLVWKNGFLTELINQRMDVLTTYLDWNMDALRVIDESGFKGQFDMDLAAEVNHSTGYLNVQKIRTSLRRYGFDLILDRRLIDILVIREKVDE